MAVVQQWAAVAAESMLETLENPQERAGKFHYPMTSVGDVEKADIRKGQPCKAVEASLQKLWNKGAL